MRVALLDFSHWPLSPSAGISFKTQVLYVVVFLARYLDMFLGEWVSLYNTAMKLFFIGSSAYILYLMKVRFRCCTFCALLTMRVH